MLSYAVIKKKSAVEVVQSCVPVYNHEKTQVQKIGNGSIKSNTTDAIEDLIHRLDIEIGSTNSIEKVTSGENSNKISEKERHSSPESPKISQSNKTKKKKLKQKTPTNKIIQAQKTHKLQLEEIVAELKDAIPVGFELNPLIPDNFSFFRCISHELFSDKNSYSSILIKSTAFIRKNHQIFKNIISNIPEYLKDVSENKFDEPIFLASALSYKFNLYIYYKNDKKFTTINYNQKYNHEIFLFNDEHFYILNKACNFTAEPMKFILHKINENSFIEDKEESPEKSIIEEKIAESQNINGKNNLNCVDSIKNNDEKNIKNTSEAKRISKLLNAKPSKGKKSKSSKFINSSEKSQNTVDQNIGCDIKNKKTNGKNFKNEKIEPICSKDNETEKSEKATRKITPQKDVQNKKYFNKKVDIRVSDVPKNNEKQEVDREKIKIDNFDVWLSEQNLKNKKKSPDSKKEYPQEKSRNYQYRNNHNYNRRKNYSNNYQQFDPVSQPETYPPLYDPSGTYPMIYCPYYIPVPSEYFFADTSYYSTVIPDIPPELSPFYFYNDEYEPIEFPVYVTEPPLFPSQETFEERIKMYNFDEPKNNSSSSKNSNGRITIDTTKEESHNDKS